MSIFNDPKFKRMVLQAKIVKWWGLARCIYCWALLFGPTMLFTTVINAGLPPVLVWIYLLLMPVCMVVGVVEWIRGLTTLNAPIHYPAKRFVKKPSEERLLKICAVLVANRKDRRYPAGDYDYLRQANSMINRDPSLVSTEAREFYVLVLRTCNVAGV